MLKDCLGMAEEVEMSEEKMKQLSDMKLMMTTVFRIQRSHKRWEEKRDGPLLLLEGEITGMA